MAVMLMITVIIKVASYTVIKDIVRYSKDLHEYLHYHHHHYHRQACTTERKPPSSVLYPPDSCAGGGAACRRPWGYRGWRVVSGWGVLSQHYPR